MITFFRKLFKRGDFMTRADKWYYSKVIKTWLWSAFAFVIIAWVGTNLVLCALSTNVKNNWDIIFTVPKDVQLPTADVLQKHYKNTKTKTITFDRYTAEINKKIAGLTGTPVVEDVMVYKSADGADVYFLSNSNMVVDESCYKMFDGYYNRKLNYERIVLNNFDTKNVTTMNQMFYQAYCLQEIVGLNHFDTSNVTDMSYMFGACEVLTSIDVSSFDTSKVTNMASMFYSCELLTNIDVSSFDTSNVTKMNSMFSSCYSLQEVDLSSFYTPVLEDTSYMFYGDKELVTIYASDRWDNWRSHHWAYPMFDNNVKLVGGSGTKFDPNNVHSVYGQIDNGSYGYFTYKPYSGK